MIRRGKEDTPKEVQPDFSKRSEPVAGGMPIPKEAPAEKEPIWDAREAVTACGVCGNINFGLLNKGGEMVSLWCTRCGAEHAIAIISPHHLKQQGDHKNTIAGVLLYKEAPQ